MTAAKRASLPPWERGLKRCYQQKWNFDEAVAPSVGAWIETNMKYQAMQTCVVAPSVGAWIETRMFGVPVEKHGVAPSVGAWIETKIYG